MTAPARHVAIITAPLPGHLNPLQVLGAALAALGWRVSIVHLAAAARFVTEPAVGYAPLPERGEAAGRLDAYLAMLARPAGPIGFPRMIRATAGMTAALLDGAPGVLRRIGADAVIADAVEPAGPLIAQHLGLPHVVAVTGLPLMREGGVPPPFLGWRHRPGAWGRFRDGGGHAVSDLLMRPITRVIDARRVAWGIDRDRQPPRLHVAQCPRGLDFPRTVLPPGFRYGSPWRHASADDVALPAHDVILPDDGRPLVFCSLGTLQGSRPALFATMARACAAVGARAVIAHGGGLTPAQVSLLPGDPVVRAFWPQEAVLSRCAAAVVHGGFNTVLDALAAGVPIVALPIAFEQPATAARLARIGAGRVLSPRLLGRHALAGALRAVLAEPGYRDAARRIAGEIAGDGGAPRAAAAINAALANAL